MGLSLYSAIKIESESITLLQAGKWSPAKCCGDNVLGWRLKYPSFHTKYSVVRALQVVKQIRQSHILMATPLVRCTVSGFIPVWLFPKLSCSEKKRLWFGSCHSILQNKFPLTHWKPWYKSVNLQLQERTISLGKRMELYSNCEQFLQQWKCQLLCIPVISHRHFPWLIFPWLNKMFQPIIQGILPKYFSQTIPSNLCEQVTSHTHVVSNEQKKKKKIKTHLNHRFQVATHG